MMEMGSSISVSMLWTCIHGIKAFVIVSDRLSPYNDDNASQYYVSLLDMTILRVFLHLAYQSCSNLHCN